MSRTDGAVIAAKAAFLGTRIRIIGTVVGVIVAALIGSFALGVLGAPAVQEVDNRFGEVRNDTTEIHTDLLVDNPNPIGIQLGNTTVNYTVRMNDVPIAVGGREGLDIETGNSTLPFTTRMDNGQIPAWWVTHVNNDERTVVTINATIRTSILGRHRYDITQEKVIQTAIIGNFNSNETRPVESDDPPPVFSNPVLYVNRTSARWGEATADATPIDMEFLMYNPQTTPFTITELGYEITMNGVPVGEGRTDDITAIPPGTTETVRTRARITNPNLDDWWVTHLRNDQVTNLRIEFYATVSADAVSQDVRVPLDRLTYEETIETDIFGNKNADEDEGPATTPTQPPAGTESTPTPPMIPDPVDTPTDTDELL
jgi:LEA14-like dessication related protein